MSVSMFQVPGGVHSEYKIENIDVYKAEGCPVPREDDIGFLKPSKTKWVFSEGFSDWILTR